MKETRPSRSYARVSRHFDHRLYRLFLMITASVIFLLTLPSCSTAPVLDRPRPPSVLMVPPPDLEPVPQRALSQREILDIMIRDAGQYNDIANQLELLQEWVNE